MDLRVTLVAIMVLALATPASGQDDASEDEGWSAAALSKTEDVAALAVGVAAGPDSIVVVGQRTCVQKPQWELGRCWGQPWVSADGRAWRAVDARTSGLDLGLFQHWLHGPGLGLAGVAHGPAGFVAYGWAVPEASMGTKAERRGVAPIEPTLWQSGDGTAWSRLPSPDGFSTEGLMVTGPWLRAITGTEDGYLLAGTIYDTPAPRAAIWSSPDGLEWTLAGPETAFDVGAYIDTMEIPAAGGISAFAVEPSTDGETGGVIAVGSACPKAKAGAGPKGRGWKAWDWTTGECQARIWRSVDGLTWRAGALEDASGSQVEAFAADAVATIGSAEVVGVYPKRILYAGEESTWAASSDRKARRQRALAASEAGFHAFVPKCVVDRCRRRTLAAWSSPDGAEWALDASQPALPVGVDEFVYVDATAFGDRTVAIAGYFPSRGDDFVSVALLSPARSALPVLAAPTE